MQRLTASDAIAPAWDHTKKLLFSPLDWRVLLKVGAVALFAQLSGFNVNLPTRGMNHVPGALPQAWMTGLLVGSLLVFVLCLVLLYVGSRLQFVLFEIVLRRDTRVGPMWQRYGQATWRWLGLKLLLFVALIVCLVPLLVPFFLSILRSARHGQQPAFDLGGMITGFMGLFLGMLLLGLAFAFVYVLLVDFGLPSIALEATSIGETLRRVWALLRAETGQVLLYFVLRFVLGIAGGVAAYLVWLVAVLVLAIPFGALAVALYLPLQHATGNGHVLMITGLIVVGTVFAAVAFCVLTMIFGVLLVFVQAYALYFLGGRYPRLSEYLEPGLSVPFTPPPPLPGPDEGGDDDGPSLPMNPALA